MHNRITMQAGIKESVNTPSVKILSDEHRIVITGQSRLEDPSMFYEELAVLFDESINDFKTHTSIDFFLNYLNSSSSKWLFHILKGIQGKFNGKKIVTVNWHFDEDDDSMLEAGEVFQSLLSLPFNLVENGN
jgi:SiaC family regulatory phosphoprotein